MQFYRHYITGLPYALVPCTYVSFSCAMFELINARDIIYPHHKIMNYMGLISIGAFIGVTYPISMPLLAGRYLYCNRIM